MNPSKDNNNLSADPTSAQPQRALWGSRFGFYFAAMGSAFGLGNIWRFPYVVGENGGGAFVFSYICLVALIGVPLLVAELMLGKISRQGILGATQFAGLKKSKSWNWLGRIATLVSWLVLSYYAVVSGWVLFFAFAFLLAMTGLLNVQPTHLFSQLMSNGWLQVALSLFHMGLAGLIASKGFREGVERWIGFVMSLFMILVVILVYQSLRLPGAEQALKFIFYPDFTELRLSSWSQIVGHVFFTLSIGFGAMVVFGSYLPPSAHSPTEAVRVASLDTVLSLLAGLLIFPVAFSFIGSKTTGPGLLFESVPLYFHESQFGPFFGFLFFLCLYCAALGATLGLMESSVSDFVDRWNFTRPRASLLISIIVFVGSLLPALGSSILQFVQFRGMSLLGVMDNLLMGWVLPSVALGFSLLVGFKLDHQVLKKEFFGVEAQGLDKVYKHWLFILRWVAPPLIFAALALNVYDTFFKNA